MNYIIGKVKERIYSILRLRPLSYKILLLLYKSYVLPTMDYGDIVWQYLKNSLDSFSMRMLRKLK